MNSAMEGSLSPDRSALGRVARTAVGVALGTTGVGLVKHAEAQSATSVQLPPVSVQGTQTQTTGSYQSTMPALNKLTKPLLDTPQSIAVIPQQLMQDQGITTLRDALRDVPGVSLQAGEGGQQGDNLSIRGFNAQNDFYLDGMRDFGSYYRDPFDTETVEVLKGPSSVLFGRGSTGGTINQVSKQAQLSSVTAGTLSFGTDGTERLTADVDRAIPGLTGAAIRLNAMVDRDGVAGRPEQKNRRFGLAPSLAFGLGTDTRVRLNYLHQQSYDVPDYGIPWLNGKPAPVSRSNFYGFPDHDHFRTNVDIGTVRVEHDFNDNFSVDNQLRYASYTRDVRVTEPLISAYGGQNIAPVSMPLSSILVNRHVIGVSSRETTLDNQTDFTARFDTGPIHHTVVSGIEVSRQTSDPTRYNIAQLQTGLLDPDTSGAFNLAQPISSIAGNVANDYAAYITDTIDVTPKLQVIAGWRFDRFDSSFNQITAPVANISRNDDLPTWRAAVV